jgi:L-threonylcarbamoyladenylate synthase
MLESHYAPDARLLLVPPTRQAARVADLRARGLDVGVLAFAPGGPIRDARVVDLGGSEEEAARGLYAAMRELDAAGCDVILAWPPEERGLGLAIADRLRRAAASD